MVMSSSSEKLVAELRERMKEVPPLEEEPDFFTFDETLLRFLKAREWKVKDAEKQLLSTIEWRRKYRPLSVDCTWCHKKPGLHTLRQVGFDESGRPVIYSSFSQSSATKNSVEESIAHVTYLIENAKKTMKTGVGNFVLIIDCSGVTLQACNPKFGYEITQMLSNYYPERLGIVFCVNHSSLFEGIWKAIKVFLHPNTSKKVKLLKKSVVVENFQKVFNQELIDWVLKEMQLNKSKVITEVQRRFWFPYDQHDPRGSPSYVAKYCEILPEGAHCHKPHPNIMDALSGKLTSEESLKLMRTSSVAKINKDNIGADESLDEWEAVEDNGIEIPTEYQIPNGAKPIN